jgi:hypothetical protein
MGISEFHNICGGATDGMATTESGAIMMPFKPKAGRKAVCVGSFYFENFRLTQIEKVAPETES